MQKSPSKIISLYVNFAKDCTKTPSGLQERHDFLVVLAAFQVSALDGILPVVGPSMPEEFRVFGKFSVSFLYF